MVIASLGYYMYSCCLREEFAEKKFTIVLAGDAVPSDHVKSDLVTGGVPFLRQDLSA